MNTANRRRNMIIAAFFMVLALFVGRLLQMQLIQGDYYEGQIYKGTVKTQVVSAARGEILDRYGNPLAMNRVSFDVVLDRTFLEKSKQNETILSLTELLASTEETWIDNLPITTQEPYAFLPEQEAAVMKLKRFAQVNDYADASETMHWLSVKFGLEYDTEKSAKDRSPSERAYSEKEKRILIGVLYEMEQKGFNISTPYVFAKDISVETTTKIKESNFTVPGVDVIQSVVRDYPDGTIAPHILGITGKIWPEDLEKLGSDYSLDDTVGISGIEKAYEKELRGVAGERKIYISDSGEVTGVAETKAPKAGDSIILTIDSRIQKVAQESLEKQIKYLQETAPTGQGKEAFSGAAVAIDTKTGEVLAMATYPSYNLSTYSKDYTELNADTVNSPLLNRALQGTYTPGSIFKPVVGLSALESGEITRESTVHCGHVYTYFDDYQPTCLGNHGDITLENALKYSCNIFFYDVGRRVGIDSINKHAQDLGLGVESGIELPSASGRLSSPEYSASIGDRWTGGDVIQASIGQKDNKFTPVQLANYCATLANKGKRNKVTLIKGIKDYSMEKTIYTHTPEIVADLQLPGYMFDNITDGLVAASRTGTAAHYFGNYRMDVASKTGTPETATEPNSTFIAFAPAQAPEIAVSVIIEKGWHGYTGAPVAKDIFDAYFSSEVVGEGNVPQGVLLP